MNNSVSAVKNNGPACWSLRLLGSFELRGLASGEKVALPGKRERALLTCLALSPKGRQPRRKLAALLWGDATDETLLDNLRTCIWRLRKALGDTEHVLIASDDEDIVLDSAAFDIDVMAFRCLAAQSERSALESAAKLCGGEFLDGLELDSEEFESWRRLEASRCRDQAIDVLIRLMKLLAGGAETEHAIEIGAAILRLEPLHEATARQMMQLYAEAGRRGAALQLYRTLAEALRREVNTQPEAATTQVFAAIARGTEEKAPSPILIDPMPYLAGANAVNNAPATLQAIPPQVSRFVLARRVSLGVLAAAVIGVAALMSYWRMAPAPRAVAAGTPAVAADRVEPAVQTVPIAITVLAFDNLSGDAEQQFFSDGISEEISAALAKIPGLELIARSSAFQFRGDKDVHQVGAALGARYLIEGTVRKTQNRVRITAELIRAADGVIVWSDSYERELTDIFVIQEDIATAIAEALRVSLGVAAGTHLVASRSIDPKSYEEFLRARPLARARLTGVPQAIEILEPLLKRNPNYAPAWALLATCYSLMPAFVSPRNLVERRRRIDKYWPEAEAAAHRAMELDPALADSYISLVQAEEFRGKWAVAEDLASKALALDPDNPDILWLQMELYADVGYRKKALAAAERLRALEPYVPTWKQDVAELLWEDGQSAGAIEMLKSVLDRPSASASLAMMVASTGRYTDAADVLETSLKTQRNLLPEWRPMFRFAIDLLRVAPSKVVLQAKLSSLDRVGFVYLYVGAPAHAVDNYQETVKSGLTGGQGMNFSYVWNASYAPARKTEEFKSFARDAGFVDYWRKRGWPEFCQPLGADDFKCL